MSLEQFRPVIKMKRRGLGTIKFVANSTEKIELPKVNAIRKIIVRPFIEVTSIATEPVEIVHTILNIIKKVRVVIDGDENKINIDGLTLFMKEKRIKGTEPDTNKDDDQTTTETKLWFAQLTVDFATNILFDADASALLPAKKFSKLDLELDWGKIEDMFSVVTAVTIAAANSGAKVEIVEAHLLNGNAKQKSDFADGRLIPFADFRESMSTKEFTGVTDNFEDNFTEDKIHPVPSDIYMHMIQVYAGSGVSGDDLSDTILTDAKILDIEGDTTNIFTAEYDLWKSDIKTQRSLESLDVGFVSIDYLDYLGRPLANRNTDDTLKLRLLHSATGSIKKYTLYRVS